MNKDKTFSKEEVKEVSAIVEDKLIELCKFKS